MKTEIYTSKLLDDFFENTDFKQESTALNYRRTIPYFVQFLTQQHGKLIITATTADAIAYKRYLKNEKKLTPPTIDNYFAALRKFYNYLVEAGVCEKNIMANIERVRDKHPVFARAWLTLDQVYQLMNALNTETVIGKRNKAIVHLMSCTGLRCIEVSKLTFDDIQYNYPDNSKLQVQRKGSNEKSGQITIPDDILTTMKEYWDLRSDDLSGKVPLFMSHAPRTKGTALQPQSISKMVKAGLRNIGLNTRQYSCHGLRATAAKLARLAESGLYEIQYMLGHSSPSQTEHYLRGLGDSTGEEGKAILNICNYARKQRENNIK